MESGKTSDLELDKIYQTYLPNGRVLRCNFLPTLTLEKVQWLRETLMATRQLYAPLFLRHHWIAGILTWDEHEGYVLSVYDSAPSFLVYKDLMAKLRDLWPELCVVTGECVQQERGSEDCGIHMTAVFFSAETQTPIEYGETLGRRLRPFLVRAVVENMDRSCFLQSMCDILSGGYGICFLGGGKKTRRSALAYKPATRGKKQIENLKHVDTIIAHISEDESHLETEKLEGPTRQKETENEDDTRNGTVGDDIQENIGNNYKWAQEMEAAAAARQLCYLLTAVALANVGDGLARSMTIDSVANRAARYGFAPRRNYDLGDALAAMGKDLDIMEIKDDGTHGLLLRHPPAKDDSEIYVQAVPGTMGLPPSIGRRAFKIGAVFTGDIRYTDSGIPYAEEGHYRPTLDCKEAVYAVYLPEDRTSYSRNPRGRQRGAKITIDTPPRAMDTPRGNRKECGDDMSLLHDPCENHLNKTGLQTEGSPASPLAWYIYPDMPSSVNRMAWAAKTKETRRRHIHWLNEIQRMPHQYRDWPLHKAILEMVRCMAVRRKWAWATVAKALVSIESALANLPLYTDQTKGIFLKEHPEWREAVAGAQLREKESVPTPPEPITVEQFMAIHKTLSLKHPKEALFLTMMWMFAARAGDISRLRVGDVDFRDPDKDGNVPTALTIRIGKGAKFRGPYTVASILPRKAASMLLKLMAQKTKRQRIFDEVEALRSKTLRAVRSINPRADLPSLRKGAAQHLARLKVPEDQIARLTGHRLMDTLRRYLGYGRLLTREAVEAQDNAGRLRPSRNS